MNKKTFTIIIAVCIVFAVLFALMFPAYYRFKSYDEFLNLVSDLKHFKMQGFYEEPLGLHFANEFVSGSLNPNKISLLRNSTVQSFVNKSDYSVFDSGLLPASYFGFFGERAKKYFPKKYRISMQGVNNVNGFSKSFFARFYNPGKHILILVVLRYNPDIVKRTLLFTSDSLRNLCVGRTENYLNFAYAKDISKYFGNNEGNVNEDVDMYSGKHFTLTIVSLSPKTKSIEKNNEEGYTILSFEKEILLKLYNLKK